MWYYVKQTLFVLGLLLFMILTSSAIVMIKTDWVKLALSFLNIALFAAAIFLAFFNDGQEAYKTLKRNDKERLAIIETGEDRKIEREKEYHPVKGFMFGLSANIPLVILLIIHLIIHLTGSDSIIMGQAAGFIYYVLYVPISVLVPEITYESFFYLLYAIPFLSVLTGVPYLLGARKMKAEEMRIEEIKEKIKEAKR